MIPDGFMTKHRNPDLDVLAPDGSEVRVLCSTRRGSMAEFTLRAGAVARAIRHRSVDEVWYVLRGTGRMWRKQGERTEITELRPGVSLSIPVGVSFQFRCDGPEALAVVAMTMPPWPGPEEAVFVPGEWPVPD